ncbi:MAG TPA: glycosyltransferase family 2 protein [Hanamia sp.]|nr:glycosyltransferase family 2 protein [Hanamia sp.]
MTKEMPLVSVLMTAYNREKYIAEAIESVLASTYKNFELIVIDDASLDNTVTIAKKYESEDPRIKVHVNETNLQQFPNRNKAASFASGKYIKYFDSDDKIYDWGLSYCVEWMEKYPEAGMGIFQAQNKVEEEYLKPDEAVNKHFFQNSFLNIGPSGIILRRDSFEKAGRYKPDYGVPSDMYFNIKMASLFPVVMLKKEFFFYREHEGQEIKNRFSYLFYNYPFMRDILKLQELPVSEQGKRQLLLDARKSFLKECLRNIKNTHRITPVYQAMKLSGLKFPDIVKTIFS